MKFMTWSITVVYLLAAFAVTVPAAHAQQPWVAYDNFNRTFIDPSKWSTLPGCPSFTVLDCVREIQNGELRLAVNGYGQTSSNQGNQFGASEVQFIDPVPIKAISSQLVVRRTSAIGCPANTGEPSHAHALMTGSFFNSGSGNSADDVQAFIIFDRVFSDPTGVTTAQAFLFWQGQFFGGVGLGQVKVGQEVIARLTWDQAHHQFVASWTNVDTGKMVRAAMPYTMPDTTPAATPFKLLGVRTFTPNCIVTRPVFANMEATFDDVRIGK